MKKTWLAGALLLACASGAFAQHDHDKKPAMDPATAAMVAAGTPGAAHKALDAMVGNWETKASFWMAPGAPPITSDGTSENRWVMGGRYLEQRFKGNFGGMPFEGLGFTGYDNVKKQYWGTWMDSMSTAIMTTTGTASTDGKTWSFTGSMTDPMTGKDIQVVEKVFVTDADHHTFEMWMPGPDGKSYKSMEIVYSRKK